MPHDMKVDLAMDMDAVWSSDSSNIPQLRNGQDGHLPFDGAIPDDESHRPDLALTTVDGGKYYVPPANILRLDRHGVLHYKTPHHIGHPDNRINLDTPSALLVAEIMRLKGRIEALPYAFVAEAKPAQRSCEASTPPTPPRRMALDLERASALAKASKLEEEIAALKVELAGRVDEVRMLRDGNAARRQMLDQVAQDAKRQREDRNALSLQLAEVSGDLDRSRKDVVTLGTANAHLSARLVEEMQFRVLAEQMVQAERMRASGDAAKAHTGSSPSTRSTLPPAQPISGFGE